MASIYQLKPAFQNLLRPLVGSLARRGVTANQVTLAAVAISIGAGAFLALRPTSRWALALVPVTLALRMALNAIDGMLAREHGMKSPLGAILNELGDVISDAALYLPFALHPAFDARLVVLTVFVGFLTELAGVIAIQIGSERRYDGPFGKSDRALEFGVIGLWLACGWELGIWGNVGLGIMIVLGLVTIVNRAGAALRAPA